RRRTDLRVEIDRDRAGALGVPTAEAVRSVRLAVAGLPIGTMREADGDSYGIRVRARGPERPTPDALSRVYVSSLTGAQVPLAQIATVPFATSPNVVQRRNGERVVTVSADVRRKDRTDAVTRDVRDRIDELELPPGARVDVAGEAESRAESFEGLGSAVIFAVFAILAVLVLEFKTLRSTLVVATVIPLGVLGGITALWAFGYSLSFTAAIGFIALVGIEIKSSILLVDLTNQLRREGASLDEALQRAGEVRFLPIVLTTATALGGLVPLALEGSPLYSPLALVIIGGLITSTLLARLVTPAAYKLLAA
ncbi:MAG: efflux RND transporter permease subunit, partial [Polyangiaceae bacterium]|nr:efflux RND transporter permease subunit [Polyangiaceae bacterium]